MICSTISALLISVCIAWNANESYRPFQGWLTYNHRGNLLTLNRYGNSSTPTDALSYSYNGPKRTGWSYDPNGNVTSDASNSVSIAWNVIDMPRTLTSGTTSTQRFYLADGTLSHIQDGTQMRIYLGDIVFKIVSGSFGIESAAWEGGRLLPGSGNDKVLYYVNDHLGSVRAVKDGSGTIRQRYDYYPYGSVSRSWSSATTDTPDKRYRFGGKEIAGTVSNATSIPAGEGSRETILFYEKQRAKELKAGGQLSNTYYHKRP